LLRRIVTAFEKGILMLTKRFEDALLFAAEKHRHQIRKGSKVPYLSHLLGVASLVIEHGGDEDEAIGALLHDVIEDQEVTEEELREKFGPRVAEIVAGCTDGVPDATTGQKPPWRQRKEAYLAHIDASRAASIRLVSTADKLHNIRSIITDYRTWGEDLWTRFSGGRETIWYYDALAKRFSAAASQNDPPGLHTLLQELVVAVEELKKLTKNEIDGQ
jgi:(p)ppGpp synthase/HD superfamily hydrolase